MWGAKLFKRSIQGSVSDSDFFEKFFPKTSATKRSSIRIAAVYTCLNVIGETFGCLPLDHRVRGKFGSEVVDSDESRLLKVRPNPIMTAFDYWSTAAKQIKIYGNSYSVIERDRAGLKNIWLVDPTCVTVTTNGRELIYTINGRVFRDMEILHFKNFSLDGITGLSAIQENIATMNMAARLRDYNDKIIQERPPGYLSTDIVPKDKDTIEKIKSSWNTSDVGKIPFLYGGVKFNQLTLPADQVAFIESSSLTVQDIYGIFRVPPALAQNLKDATYNNAEQQDLVFSKYSLSMRTAIEQECTYKLLSDSDYFKFNLKGLLAGDIMARREFYNTMLNFGVMSANDVLELEDMNGFEGGDKRFIQGGMVPLESLSKLDSVKKKKLKEILNGSFDSVLNILEN